MLLREANLNVSSKRALWWAMNGKMAGLMTLDIPGYLADLDATHSISVITKAKQSNTILQITNTSVRIYNLFSPCFPAAESYILLSFLFRFGLQGITAKAYSGLLELCFFGKPYDAKDPKEIKDLNDIDAHDIICWKTFPVHEGVVIQIARPSDLVVVNSKAFVFKASTVDPAPLRTSEKYILEHSFAQPSRVPLLALTLCEIETTILSEADSASQKAVRRVRSSRNEERGETGYPQENPLASDIVRHDSYGRKSGSDPCRKSNQLQRQCRYRPRAPLRRTRKIGAGMREMRRWQADGVLTSQLERLLVQMRRGARISPAPTAAPGIPDPAQPHPAARHGGVAMATALRASTPLAPGLDEGGGGGSPPGTIPATTAEPKKKNPYISKRNGGKRFKFANKYRDKEQLWWEKDIVADKSKFSLRGSYGRQIALRKTNQELTTTSSSRGLYDMAGELVFIDYVLQKEDYTNLRQNLRQSAKKLRIARKFMLYQDNDPKHTSHIVRMYMNMDITVLNAMKKKEEGWKSSHHDAADLPWRSRLVCHRSGMLEALAFAGNCSGRCYNSVGQPWPGYLASLRDTTLPACLSISSTDVSRTVAAPSREVPTGITRFANYSARQFPRPRLFKRNLQKFYIRIAGDHGSIIMELVHGVVTKAEITQEERQGNDETGKNAQQFLVTQRCRNAVRESGSGNLPAKSADNRESFTTTELHPSMRPTLLIHFGVLDSFPQLIINVVSMEQHRNEAAGERDPRENPLTNGIVRHDSHLRKSGTDYAMDKRKRPNQGRIPLPLQCAKCINKLFRWLSRGASVYVVRLLTCEKKKGRGGLVPARSVPAADLGRFTAPVSHSRWRRDASASLGDQPAPRIAGRELSGSGHVVPRQPGQPVNTKALRHAGKHLACLVTKSVEYTESGGDGVVVVKTRAIHLRPGTELADRMACGGEEGARQMQFPAKVKLRLPADPFTRVISAPVVPLSGGKTGGEAAPRTMPEIVLPRAGSGTHQRSRVRFLPACGYVFCIADQRFSSLKSATRCLLKRDYKPGLRFQASTRRKSPRNTGIDHEMPQNTARLQRVAHVRHVGCLRINITCSDFATKARHMTHYFATAQLVDDENSCFRTGEWVGTAVSPPPPASTVGKIRRRAHPVCGVLVLDLDIPCRQVLSPSAGRPAASNLREQRATRVPYQDWVMGQHVTSLRIYNWQQLPTAETPPTLLAIHSKPTWLASQTHFPLAGGIYEFRGCARISWKLVPSAQHGIWRKFSAMADDTVNTTATRGSAVFGRSYRAEVWIDEDEGYGTTADECFCSVESPISPRYAYKIICKIVIISLGRFRTKAASLHLFMVGFRNGSVHRGRAIMLAAHNQSPCLQLRLAKTAWMDMSARGDWRQDKPDVGGHVEAEAVSARYMCRGHLPASLISPSSCANTHPAALRAGFYCLTRCSVVNDEPCTALGEARARKFSCHGAVEVKLKEQGNPEEGRPRLQGRDRDTIMQGEVGGSAADGVKPCTTEYVSNFPKFCQIRAIVTCYWVAWYHQVQTLLSHYAFTPNCINGRDRTNAHERKQKQPKPGKSGSTSY
ncbi:hypothetical protein PR048_019854 [Dryococelus australis]|uniref:Uncharacterized protein n=1 Tax=Dryococelus australis TaxID=614101 RepID=A0ABQ9H4Z6_9NEOP|nr:hypothetical protein PR048_019854 [Dryococelus australis]